MTTEQEIRSALAVLETRTAEAEAMARRSDAALKEITKVLLNEQDPPGCFEPDPEVVVMQVRELKRQLREERDTNRNLRQELKAQRQPTAVVPPGQEIIRFTNPGGTD